MRFLSRAPMIFLKNLLIELIDNGKLLIGYALYQLPNVTSFPGFTTALKTALADRTTASYIDLLVQVLLGIAAASRAVKVVEQAKVKTIS